jgi:hypothetical protein
MRKIFFKFLKISILWPFTFYSDPALAYCVLFTVEFKRNKIEIPVHTNNYRSMRLPAAPCKIKIGH